MGCFNTCRIIHSQSLSKCAGCRIAVYCSKLCQKEHWHSAHKQHCNFLNGNRKLSNDSFHDDSNCRECTEGSSSETVKGCPYKNVFNSLEMYKKLLFDSLLSRKEKLTGYSEEDEKTILKMNLPFQLGELTGNYLDNTDKALGEMITIAANIEQANFFDSNDDILVVLMNLFVLRAIYWSSLLKNCVSTFCSNLSLRWMILKKISRNKLLDSNLKFKKLWKMLLLKFMSVAAGCYLSTEVNYRRPDIVERIKYIMYEIQIFQPWEGKTWSDLENLKKKLIDKVEEMSGSPMNNYSHRCSSCSSKINIFLAELIPDPDFYMQTNSIQKTVTQPCIILHWQSFQFIGYCGFPPCLPDVVKEYNKESELFLTTVNFSKNNDICDFCFGWTNSAHRCSVCKCKIYCSRDCQMNDWKVHKKVCQLYTDIGHKNVKTRQTVLCVLDLGEGSCDVVQKIKHNRLKK